MQKIEITEEIERKIDIKNTKRTIFFWKEKRVGSETNDGINYSINVRDGFSIKIINQKKYPPKCQFFINSDYV